MKLFKEDKIKRNFFRAMFFISIIAIEFLATTTTVHIEIVENIWDKANHFIAFFTLYILLSFGFLNLSVAKKIIWLLLFGVQIEVVQHFIEGRFFSTLDVFADFIGIIIALIIIKVLLKEPTEASS